MNKESTILLIGIGSIGGVIAGKLINAGYNCSLITHNEGITTAIKKKGIILYEPKKDKPLTILADKVFTKSTSLIGSFDYIFYLVKAINLREAFDQTKELLRPTGSYVFFQNGILAESFYEKSHKNVILASVIFNAIMVRPGEYALSKSEKIIIGRQSIEIDDLLLKLKDILAFVSICEISTNIIGVSWSKLAINCSINAMTAISGKNLGDVLKKKFGKEIFLDIYKETVDVAEKKGIKLEKIKIDPYLLYSGGNISFYKKYFQLILINQIAKNYASIFPSMLQDIKKNKQTEIDYLNGYISKLGKELGVSTPINDEMTSLVKNIERGFLNPDISLLKIAHEQPISPKIKIKDPQPA